MKLFIQSLGVCSTILFLLAGFKLLLINSISGDSIVESYYHCIGVMSFGFALLSGGLLISLAEKIEVSK